MNSLMVMLLPYVLGALEAIGLVILGALVGCSVGLKQERERCGNLVKEHLCSECYSRHCLLKLASQIKLHIVNDPLTPE